MPQGWELLIIIGLVVVIVLLAIAVVGVVLAVRYVHNRRKQNTSSTGLPGGHEFDNR
jgi:mannose/fructose/N-acetylgalactosamine-specific phosphotransferase system component IIC